LQGVIQKEDVIRLLKQIRQSGWHLSGRVGNHGSVGNTLEDLLGITENNLPIPNAAEWEIKAQSANTTSLTTLFHLEPSPRALKIVPAYLLPKYEWKHKEAGKKHGADEKSFRQTISALRRSDRGFCITYNKTDDKLCVSFDKSAVHERHSEWLKSVILSAGGGELYPQPYWAMTEFFAKLTTKLHNCFFVLADQKTENGLVYFRYSKILKLSRLSRKKTFNSIMSGHLFVDFDARTGHNHGTKFRLVNAFLPELYEEVEEI